MLDVGLTMYASFDKGLFCRITGFRAGVMGNVGGGAGSFGGGGGGDAEAGAGMDFRLESESVDGGRGGRRIDEEEARRALWMELALIEERRSEAIAMRVCARCRLREGKS